MVGKGRRSGGGEGGGGGASLSASSWSLMKKLIAQTCASFSWKTRCRYDQTPHGFQDDFLPTTNSTNVNPAIHLNVCAICLDPLDYNNSGGGGGGGGSTTPAIFTAQCSHAFHFCCISSNVRHGSVTCPICRAHWTHLPRNLNSRYSLSTNRSEDPILQILDDSIASFRVNRRSFLLSARYDDDDPLLTHPSISQHHHRLRISLLPLHPTIHLFNPRLNSGSKKHLHHLSSSTQLWSTHRSGTGASVGAYLRVKLELQPATDLVLVASPNGPHLRLMKQAMSLVILSLRPEDRLAIVAYSSSAARMLPLKSMTSCGKRSAIQVIDRLFHTGSADPSVGLKKGFKVLNDRVYRNPESCILHLTDSPTWSYSNLGFGMEGVDVKIYQFHVGLSFGGSHGYVMHEFEQFLAGMLGGAIRDIRLKMKEDGRIIKLGELRGGEERRVPLLLRKSAAGYYCVEYSYIESGGGTEEECNRKTGEVLIRIGADQTERNHGGLERKTSSAETWEYHDSFMARRWSKHLHGNKFLLDLNHV